MRQSVAFLVGTSGSLVILSGLVYLSGMAFSAAGIQLYSSEADQQRNFNVIVIGVITLSLVIGFLGARRAARMTRGPEDSV